MGNVDNNTLDLVISNMDCNCSEESEVESLIRTVDKYHSPYKYWPGGELPTRRVKWKNIWRKPFLIGERHIRVFILVLVINVGGKITKKLNYLGKKALIEKMKIIKKFSAVIFHRMTVFSVG